MRSNYVQIGLLALAIMVALFWWKYRQPRYITGEAAPEFTAPLASGETFKLSQTRGHYTLLQFWGSWCPPCRHENPDLLRLYQKYHASTGFEIVSVAIERNAESWQRAIQADGMIWPYQIAEMQYFDGPIPKMFNIHSIPTLFLINPEGTIIQVDPTPAAIEMTLTGK